MKVDSEIRFLESLPDRGRGPIIPYLDVSKAAKTVKKAISWTFISK